MAEYKKLFSVCIPTWNRAQMLNEQLVLFTKQILVNGQDGYMHAKALVVDGVGVQAELRMRELRRVLKLVAPPSGKPVEGHQRVWRLAGSEIGQDKALETRIAVGFHADGPSVTCSPPA